MAKRIITIDTLRGLSIFMMIFVHVFVNSSVIMDSSMDDIFSSIGLLIVFVLVFLFGHFRGFFILISGVANVYTISAAAKKGKPIGKILSRQVAGGAFLIVFGHLKDTFINQWGIIRKWYLAGGLTSENFDWAAAWAEKWQLGIVSEAIQSIGWCVLLTSVIYAIIIKMNGVKKQRVNALMLFVIAVIVLYVSEPIMIAVSESIGQIIYESSSPWDLEASGFQFVWLYFAYDLAGAEAPIFPMLAYALFGGIIGVFLTIDKNQRLENKKKADLKAKEKREKKGKKPKKARKRAPTDIKFIGGGILAGLGLIIWGGADFVIRMLFFDYPFDPFFHVHPSWYVLVAVGLQFFIVFITFRIFEFNPRKTPQKMKKETQYLRRWAMLSLTVYAFQIFEYIPRAIITRIFPQSGLRGWTEAEIVWVLLFMFLNWLMWEIIIRVSEKLKFKGTCEWFMMKLVKRGKQVNDDDPLNIQGTLYDVEPVLFIENKLLVA